MRAKLFAVDRNVTKLAVSSGGNVQDVFSHVFFPSPPATDGSTSNVNAILGNTGFVENGRFQPDKLAEFVVNTDQNRGLNLPQRQKQTGAPAAAAPLPTQIVNSTGGAFIDSTRPIFNSQIFGNGRFRPEYRLSYRGFMALLDVGYEFDDYPFKVAGAVGYISGDEYPYNDEFDQTYRGFIPLRSRYRGLDVHNFMIFDRLLVPRPLNISNRTLYAFNNLKDLSNLQYIGGSFSWFPLENRNTCAITTDVMFLWEVARLFKWDVNGKHPDPAIESQLVLLRNTINPVSVNGQLTGGQPTLFSGWLSNDHASRWLGGEIDIKAFYKLLDHCIFTVQFALFFPGTLYKDLLGQPNVLLQTIDQNFFPVFESLGNATALAFVFGLNYSF